MFFKKSIFKVFQKREQKKLWKKVVGFSLLGVFFITGLYLYLLLSPFKEFFWKMPSMLGFFGEKNYLLLVQNNAERRPTGGFISAYGELSFFLGDMDLELHDSYDIAPPDPQIEPPYPLNDLLKDDAFYKGFVFRDANWDPDFAKSVKNIVALYNEGQEEEVEFDGVIALDISAIEQLMRIVGDIEYNAEKITAENIFHKAQFYSKNIDLHSVDSLENRKNMMKEIAPELISRIIKSPSRYSQTIQEFHSLLNNKHLLLNFSKPSWQKIVLKKSWGGELNPIADDFIHVNVANIGGRKADRYIVPDYSYNVTFDESGVGKAYLDIDFHYNATQGLYTDFYQSYVRVYLPKDIRDLVSWGDNRLDFKEEKDLAALNIGTLMHIWPGETQSLHFTYTLPKYISPHNYQLELLPMSGNTGENWFVTLRNKNVDNFWSSKSFNTKENTAIFSSSLHKNTLLNAHLEQDTTPPVIIWQKFLDNKTIELNFSEKLDEKYLRPENFSLQDKNINNPEVQENPKIVSVVQDENYRVYIKLQNISWQYGEHFNLELKELFDLSGNSMSLSSGAITLVQR
ncbi:DUF4012 domain-containing protein [Candidatus Peregrinibacteria bacterium]|jgi:hypothetical protein|nr:DUF4012 domain-containing protein [Candidatus Peregrinibacteria bacterium]